MTARRKKAVSGNSLITNEDGQLRALARELLGRQILASRLGHSYGGKRDLYEALGYNKSPDYDDFISKYIRQDVAKAIVDAPVNESWRGRPIVSAGVVKETPFDREWKELAERTRIFHYLRRLDRLACIGQYAVLLVGFEGSGDLSEPVERSGDVLYVAPYSEKSAKISEWVDDPVDERYGLPLSYNLTLTKGGTRTDTLNRVHWTRVVHVAEDQLENDVFGTPRLEPVFNRLQDLETVAGGSAEMFWRGAFPGFAAEVAADATLGTQDEEALEKEIDKYVHALKRYMRLRGATINQLEVQVADPSNHVKVLLDLIAAATGIPKRILVGSERGELASTQDDKNWAQRIQGRRIDHCEAQIIRPLVDRFIEFGILSEPPEGYVVKWPDLLVLSEKERAEVGDTRSRALRNYVESIGGESIIPPRIFLREILSLDEETVEKIMAEIKEGLNDLGGGQNGNRAARGQGDDLGPGDARGAGRGRRAVAEPDPAA